MKTRLITTIALLAVLMSTSSCEKAISEATEEMIYEAENAELHGNLFIANDNSCSGKKTVEKFENDTDYVCFIIDIPKDGIYNLTFVSKGLGSYTVNNAIIDGTSIGIFTSKGEKQTESTISDVSISKGKHELKITKSWGWISLDCIKINSAPDISDEIYNTNRNLVNKNADSETEKLFNYLSDCYGKYIISGQTCNGGFYGNEFTAIYNQTGKRPAILGLDMMDYTPSRALLGAKSDAVEKAIEFSDMGGIVTFCWHWNAPTEYLKSEIDDKNPRWWGGFYTTNSTFSIANVMDGQDTNGKAAIDRDIAEIASQLNRLGDAKVPIIWRPLHEASDGWFWWGADGAEAYKKLWIYLYEELTYKYECNNLIWVFNGQHSDWYPGDEYVDIIGEDIYPGQRVYSPQTTKFREATEYSNSKKIVALTENGCLFDIDKALLSNTMWAWFCTWGGEFITDGSSFSDKYIEPDILKKMYTSKYVITFDDLPQFTH